jgi:hypothetical protein
MARRVYFAFHFERDIFRVNMVRNSNVVAGVEKAGFFDHSEYEEVKKKSRAEIARSIRERLSGTSVTVILAGRETWSREWVQYEIEQSIENKNGLLAVYIHHLKDVFQTADPLWQVPALPRIPSGVACPTMFWDWRLETFSAAVEEAGRRADQLRAADVGKMLSYAFMKKNSGWPW